MKHPQRTCPDCRISLVPVRRLSVTMDYCPACRGIWLDQGELSRLLREENGERVPPSRENHSQKRRTKSYAPGLHGLLSVGVR